MLPPQVLQTVRKLKEVPAGRVSATLPQMAWKCSGANCNPLLIRHNKASFTALHFIFGGRGETQKRKANGANLCPANTSESPPSVFGQRTHARAIGAIEKANPSAITGPD